MSELTDFKHWLKINRRHFLIDGYTSDEVAYLARLVGFEFTTICKELAHFNDALMGTNFENRLNFHMRNEIKVIDRSSGKTDLTEQWHALYKKINDDVDFDD